jgi:cell division protein FtsB
MPPARSATAVPRRQPRPDARPKSPHRVATRAPRLRVRWERVGRIGLLFVLTVVIGLYVEHALSYLATRTQADQQTSIVDRLARQNAVLSRQQRALTNPATIVNDARALGMVRPGEQAYVITGSTTH